ncbi:BTAD domain-containing putative transcriptional regulator [Streptomyces sp. NPDC093970]|uniref:AfsR/SARP family transcriptional regulator n=1 Tax=Streptomyces sp. NPDC093970 TaxID=3155076 RepID=UPI003427BE5B
MDATVHYSVLGTVRALRGDTELDLGPQKRLALLALLLLRSPGPVSVSRATDVLWDDEPPASAANVVHRHIGALRRILEPGLRNRTEAEHLTRTADGYRLLVDASTCDLLRFRELRARAQVAAEQGDTAAAAQNFLTAVALWRSPVVADGTSVARHPVFTSVGHEFVATVKEAADLVLASEPEFAEQVLTALRGAVDHHPFDEALHARIITALATTGRQAEAQDQYETIRRRLADELGVAPGPELDAARHLLLRQRLSRVTNEPAVGTDGTDGSPARPGHLPSYAVPFVDRQEALVRFREPRAGDDGHAPTTIALSGMAGAGKTTQALRWAHQAAARFPDGQVYVDLRGHHPARPALDTEDVMRVVLDTLGVARAAAAGSAALQVAYRGALTARRLLIVLDDARDCEQVRPLLPALPGSLTIVTSRRRLEGLAVTHNAQVITLNPMTPQEGIQLLARRVGADRVKAERAAAEEIVDLCGGLPLALAVVGARAVSRPGFRLASLAAQLRDGLVALSSQDTRTDVRSAFRRTCEALSAGASALFRLLGLHPSLDITASAAASLAGIPLLTALEYLTELADHHLIAEPVPGRYSCHRLLRAYAAEATAALDPPVVRSAARARMFEHYLYSAEAATSLLAPHRSEVILPPPRPGVRPQEFSGRADAFAWITAERNLLPVLAQDRRHDPYGETLRQQLTSALEMTPRRHGR